MPTVMTAIVPRPAGATAFETRSATSVTPRAVGAAATAVPSAPERPLEARARAAADPGGVAREIFARAASVWGAGFAGKQDYVLDDGRFRNGFSRGGSNPFAFEGFALGRSGFHWFMLGVFKFAEGCGMFRAFMCRIRGEFRPAGGATRFDFLGFFIGEFRIFRRWCFFRFFCFPLSLFFFKFRATDDGVGLRFFLSLFVFGFDETGGKRCDLIFVQFDIRASRFGFRGRVLPREGFLGRRCVFFRGRRFGLRAPVG